MVNHSTIVMTEIPKCYNGFDNLNSVVDVGDGYYMIVSKYPLIKGINYDLPHVIKHAPQYHGMLLLFFFLINVNIVLLCFDVSVGIEHVGGDMFHDVPQADAIFMKVFNFSSNIFRH